MTEEETEMINRSGIFGLGFSFNDNLDLLNLVVLALVGIIIKIFFQENYSKLGDVGPASTTIWGYGLTGIALFLMIFMSIHISKKEDKELMEDNIPILQYFLLLLLNNTLPIVLTLGLIIYIISLNYSYFNRINSNNVTDSYHTYSLFSSFLLIIQIFIVIKLMFNNLDSNPDDKHVKDNALLKNLSYLLISINFIFVIIINILLAFFSTDG